MLRAAILLSTILLLPSSCAQFAPGWNGEAVRPPMAWRSWNAFLANIDDGLIRANVDALLQNTSDGVSLFDVGFQSIGIDEGWEGCGEGVNHTQHYLNGTPAVNNKFPSLQRLVEYGHHKGVKMGFYQNGCACGERIERRINYEGDVRALVGYGFDSVKLDGCGRQKNLTLYAELMNKSGHSFEIENCHWGVETDDDTSSAPRPGWCPFNLFRTSGDIRQTWASWTRNLRTALPYLHKTHPVSGPSCWAYPDMLQVGNLPTFEQNRAHFGAWCIISAPLYLGFDLRNRTLLEAMWPIIGNIEALAVNQQWNGHPGWLVKAWTPPGIRRWYITTESLGHRAEQVQCGVGWKYNTATKRVNTPPLPEGAAPWSASPCLAFLNQSELDAATHIDEEDAVLVAVKCDNKDPAQSWEYNQKTHLLSAGNRSIQVDPWYAGARVGFGIKGLPGGASINQNTKAAGVPGTALFFGNGKPGALNDGVTLPNDVCLVVSPTAGGGEALQLFAKPQPHGAVAVLLINSHHSTAYSDVKIDLKEVGFKSVRNIVVRDIWARKDLPRSIITEAGEIMLSVQPRDSQFVLVSPSESESDA